MQEPESDIVQHAQTAKGLRGLKRASQPVARRLVRRLAGDVAIAYAYNSGIRVLKTADEIEQRGLPGAIRPDHAGDTPGWRDDVDAGDRHHATERDAHAFSNQAPTRSRNMGQGKI